MRRSSAYAKVELSAAPTAATAPASAPAPTTISGRTMSTRPAMHTGTAIQTRRPARSRSSTGPSRARKMGVKLNSVTASPSGSGVPSA